MEMPEFNEPPSIYYDEIERQQELESIRIHNEKLEKKAAKAKLKINKKFKIGDHIRFKKFGKKGADTLAGRITKIDGMDIVIKSENGSTIIRHVEDIVSQANKPIEAKEDMATVRTIKNNPKRENTSCPNKGSQAKVQIITNTNEKKSPTSNRKPKIKKQAEQKLPSQVCRVSHSRRRYDNRHKKNQHPKQ